MPLGNRDYQPQVRFNQFALGLLRIHVALDHFSLCALQVRKRHPGLVFQSPYFSAMDSLRSAGEITSGPKSFSPRDRSSFLSALDQAIVRLKRAGFGLAG